MRVPIFAGHFYPKNKNELKESIKKYVYKKPDKGIKAGISPHAGYVYSGKCAGKVYSVLPACETFILIGVNHSGFGKNIAVSSEDWETPLGIVENDKELGKEIIKTSGSEDNDAHAKEHSIEVQIPFLQEIQKKFKIVPIILKDCSFSDCKKLAEAIFQSAKKLNKKILPIASSDFTHSGPGYGMDIDMKIDKESINKILSFKTEEFLELARKTNICGKGAIATVIELAKLLGSKQGKLLDYYDSSRIFPNKNKVGYAGIVFL